jgi:hypothetical protein
LTIGPILLFDTSAALALVDVENPHHEAVLAERSTHTLGLAGHALWETLSVLTRLPPPNRLTGSEAARLIAHNFSQTRHLDPAAIPGLLDEIGRAHV